MFLPALLLAASLSLPQDLPTRVDTVAKKYVNEDKFSGCILVGKEGRVVFQRAYGKASKELDVPNKPDTKFRLHSVSKQFTAVAIMRLVEAGKVKTGDSVRVYLSELPQSWAGITVRHLLTHTSGLPVDVNEWGDSFSQSNLDTVREQAKSWQDRKPLSDPGAKWAYNNVNYELLAAIVERVYQKPFPVAMRELVFTPCGMKDSLISVPSADPAYGGAEFVSKLATGYNGKPGKPTVSVCYSYLIMGSGGMLSTASDVYRFASSVYGGKLLKPESLKEIMDGVDPGGGATSRYGYGVFISQAEGRKVVRHDGGNNGFIANLDIFVDDKVAIVTMSNLGYMDSNLIKELRKAVFTASR